MWYDTLLTIFIDYYKILSSTSWNVANAKYNLDFEGLRDFFCC